MKNALLIAFSMLIMLGCQTGQPANSQEPQDVHKVTVKEVIQTSNYTYLSVTEKAEESWIAVPKMEANPGETYYYRNGYPMYDFESKELGRKFAVVIFLEGLSRSPDFSDQNDTVNPHEGLTVTMDSAAAPQYKAHVEVVREDVRLKTSGKGITIAELFANKEKYNGKVVQITGKVTKYNSRILKRNWIHIQDGTEHNGKFDLTVTTEASATVGETITLEGTVGLNEDFGYGYTYDVLLEDAKPVTK